MRRIVVAPAVGAVLSLASAIACQSTPTGPPRDDSSLQTDSLVYHLRRESGAYRAYATATYENRSGRSVFFARCNGQSATPMFSLRRTGSDSTRTLFTDWAWACVGGVPTGEIPPGGSVTVRVPLGSVDQPRMQPPLRPEHLIGLLRIELTLCARFRSYSDDCDALPQRDRQSNAFEVRF